MISQAGQLVAQVNGERAAADRYIARFTEVDPEQLRLAVSNAPTKLRRALAESLIERARRGRHEDLADTQVWANVALVAAQGLDPVVACSTLARAWAEVGNARRIAADLSGAEEALAEARRLARICGSEPSFIAELLSLRGSVAHYRRDFCGALRHVEKAARVAANAGDHRCEARSLFQAGAIHAKLGQPLDGFPPALRAYQIAQALGDDQLMLIGLQNLIHLAVEAGDAELAHCWIGDARKLFELIGKRLDRLRFEWVAARVQDALGLPGEAAVALSRLRRQYLEERMPYEVALVSLDLAGIYGRLGRRADLRELAAECLALFRSLGVAREALASLRLLAEAEQAEAASLVAELAAAVDAARRSRPRGTASRPA